MLGPPTCGRMQLAQRCNPLREAVQKGSAIKRLCYNAKATWSTSTNCLRPFWSNVRRLLDRNFAEPSLANWNTRGQKRRSQSAGIHIAETMLNVWHIQTQASSTARTCEENTPSARGSWRSRDDAASVAPLTTVSRRTFDGRSLLPNVPRICFLSVGHFQCVARPRETPRRAKLKHATLESASLRGRRSP